MSWDLLDGILIFFAGCCFALAWLIWRGRAPFMVVPLATNIDVRWRHIGFDVVPRAARIDMLRFEYAKARRLHKPSSHILAELKALQNEALRG